MSTAIVGLGNIGSRLAKNLTAGGEKIIVAEKTLEKAEKLAKELGSNAQAMSVPEAIKKSDVVILAIYLDAIKQFVATYRDLLVGKVVVDPSNPIAPDGKGGFKKTIPRISRRVKLSLPFFLRARSL
jgi:predicted dinucleotide-binding enzyme